MSPKEVQSTLGAMWRELDLPSKEVYKESHKAARVRYEAELKQKRNERAQMTANSNAMGHVVGIAVDD